MLMLQVGGGYDVDDMFLAYFALYCIVADHVHLFMSTVLHPLMFLAKTLIFSNWVLD